MATSDSDSDYATKRCTAEPIRVPTTSVNPAATTSTATTTTTTTTTAKAAARMAAHSHSHSYPYPSPASGPGSSRNPQNNNGGGVPLATIFPQLQTAPQPTDQLGAAAGVAAADHLIDDSGTESGEELRSLNPQLLAEVRGALGKLENALPNLDAARRTSLIPLVNKLQSCLKVTETTPSPSPSSPYRVQDSAAKAAGDESTIASAAAAAAASSKNRKTRHTVGVSREELNDARKWLIVAQNVAHHFDQGGGGGDGVMPTPSSPRLQSSLSQAPVKYESSLNGSGKVYKPVKFTPTSASTTPTPILAGCYDDEAIGVVVVDEKNAATFTRQHCATTELLAGASVDDAKFVRDGKDDEKRSDNETTARSKPKCKPKSESESEYWSGGEPSDFSSSEEESRVTVAAATFTASNETWKKPTPSRFQRKTNKNKRMKRANTIDVVPNPNRSSVAGGPAAAPGADAARYQFWLSSDETATAAATTTYDQRRTAKIAPIATVGVGAPLAGKPNPPKLQLKTENDKKFAAFLEHAKHDESQSHSKTSAAYNPSAAGGVQWSNRFSNIKTTFESAQSCASSPPPLSSSPRPPSLIPASASVAKSSHMAAPHSLPVRQAAAATTVLPRQSFTHAQRSPFKPVTKVAPFHTRSSSSSAAAAAAAVQAQAQTGVKQQPKSLSFKMASDEHRVHAPKTYYSPVTASASTDDKKMAAPATMVDAIRPKKPLTPTVYYAKNDYFLNEPSSYLHGGGGIGQALCSPSPPLFAAPWLCVGDDDNADVVVVQSCTNPPTAPASNQYSYRAAAEREPYFETQTQTRIEAAAAAAQSSPSPRNGLRSNEFSQQRAPVAKIMGTAQQSVATLVDSKTNYRSPPPPPPPPQQQQQQQQREEQSRTSVSKSTTTVPANASSTYQKLAKKSPSLQNFTKTQPKAWSSSSSSPQKCFTSSTPPPPSLSSTPSSQTPLKKQIRILTLNESEENLPEQFFVLNQRNKFEKLGKVGGGGEGGSGGRGLRTSQQAQAPIRFDEKAFFKPLTAAPPATAPTVVVQQSRSPPQSPVVMPSVLQKSESWHQMIMERMKQAKPPSPIRQHIPRAKSTHNLTAMPKQYEPSFTAQDIAAKQQTVQQFLNKTKHSRSQSQSQSIAFANSTRSSSSPPPVRIQRLNEDYKHVDEAFDILFEEASGKCTKTNRH